MRFEHTYVFNFRGALRGMRNPLASWDRSDSYFGLGAFDEMPEFEVAYSWAEQMNPGMDHDSGSFIDIQDEYAQWLREQGVLQGNYERLEYAFIGPNDMDLAMRLCAAGPEHRKFLRQIQVSVDITAPLYWWKEFDTYKIGTTANSTSTMHKLASTPITLDCFEMEDYNEIDEDFAYEIEKLIEFLEYLRQKYNETKDKRYWKELVRWLPNGWLQTRTVTMNYENLRSICHQREGHKLIEWHQFVKWTHTLPYAEQFIFGQPVAFD